jgi:hypothetical protein
MQFGAYSNNGDKLKDHIEQGSSSWCVNNLKQSGLSASALLLKWSKIPVSRGEMESAISHVFSFRGGTQLRISRVLFEDPYLFAFSGF